MINKVYRLTGKQSIKEVFLEEEIKEENLFVRPTYLSICAADQRYYNFERPSEVLKKKLPMALIHEAIGEVVYDPKGEYEVGQAVVLIPGIPTEKSEVIAENYLTSSLFRSSGYDGFLQEVVNQPRDRVVKLKEHLANEVLAYTELMSVAVHAINRFLDRAHQKRDVIGVWGDGNLGFILSLFLKYMLPESEVIVFGKNKGKLDLFTFVDKTCLIEEANTYKIDHAFECVGGMGSQYAINQIIDIINPEGYMSLLGVSENEVEVNTRMVLEKGLTMVGNSRSRIEDYQEVVDMLEKNEEMVGYLESLIASIKVIRSISNINEAFEQDKTKMFGKTILKWEI